MLKQFTVKNFRSIKDELTLSMEAEGLKNNKESITRLATGDEILPLAAVFGRNASGKSNLFKALDWMVWAIKNPNYLQQPIVSHVFLQPFLLNVRTRKQPSFFEIVLWDEKQSTEYRYGFEVSRTHVVSEWLEVNAKVEQKFRKRMIFTRNQTGFDFLSKKATKDLGMLTGKVLPTALAVNVFAQFNVEPAINFLNLVSSSIFALEGRQDIAQLSLERCLTDKQYESRILKFLQDADTAINGLSVVKGQLDSQGIEQIRAFLPINGNVDTYNVHTTHKVHGSPDHETFKLGDQESVGTTQLFGFAAVIMDTLDNGHTLIIDEFGSSLHPFISLAITRQFLSKKTNRKGAQLIIFTHESYLLSKKSDLRRDQIWFVDKNEREETTMHSLAEYRTRNDYEIAKNYLEGRFGALPRLTFE